MALTDVMDCVVILVITMLKATVVTVVAATAALSTEIAVVVEA